MFHALFLGCFNMTYRVLSRDENHIVARILEMTDMVSGSIESSIQCLCNFDRLGASHIIENDSRINQFQREIERECYVTIARQQPVARDLRIIISDMVIAMELERIADYAADIARIVMQMKNPVNPALMTQTESLARKCLRMLVDIMKAYKEGDAETARRVAASDDGIDADEQKITGMLLDKLCKDTGDHEIFIGSAFLLRILHDIERIGDRVTNIAERIVFIATGEIEDLNQ